MGLRGLLFMGVLYFVPAVVSNLFLACRELHMCSRPNCKSVVLLLVNALQKIEPLMSELVDV